MNWAQIRTAARMRLNDPLGKIWTDEELLFYANDSMDDITRDGEATIAHYSFEMVEGQRAYSLPSDLWELRGVKINGPKIFGVTAFDLEEIDAQYLTATGQPKFYYLDDPQTIAFYPVPNWTSNYGTFNSDYGEIVSITDGSSAYSISSDYGIVTEVIDTGMAAYYSVVPEFGVSVSYDTAPYVCLISYVYELPDLVDDSSIPDLPEYMHYAILYSVVAKALERDGQGQDLTTSEYYFSRNKELVTEWFGRNREFAHGQDQFVSTLNANWGSDLDWRQRIWP